MKLIDLVFAATGLAIPIAAAAHVVVGPLQVGMGRFQVFTVSVPVEKDQATVGVRVLVPEGLEAVLPTLKPGWNIAVKRAADGEPDSVQGKGAQAGPPSAIGEIVWSGGSIPPGRRDEFSFSARVPVRESALAWKAYQTYADGSVVSWDRDPKEGPPRNAEGKPDFSRYGPWSLTRVVDDLKSKDAGPEDLSLWIAALALAVALLALGMAWSRRHAV